MHRFDSGPRLQSPLPPVTDRLQTNNADSPQFQTFLGTITVVRKPNVGSYAASPLQSLLAMQPAEGGCRCELTGALASSGSEIPGPSAERGL